MSLTNSISYTAASRGLKSEICYWALWWAYQKAASGEPDPVPRVPGATQSILCCCAVGAFPALPLAAGSTRPWKQCAMRITTTAAAMVNGCLLSAALLGGEMQALRRAHREGVRRSSEPCFSQPHGSWQLWLLVGSCKSWQEPNARRQSCPRAFPPCYSPLCHVAVSAFMFIAFFSP